MKFINKISHYGDIAAIPFFLITLIYFYRIKNKTLLEYVITSFIGISLFADILFTYIFLTSKS